MPLQLKTIFYVKTPVGTIRRTGKCTIQAYMKLDHAISTPGGYQVVTGVASGSV